MNRYKEQQNLHDSNNASSIGQSQNYHRKSDKLEQSSANTVKLFIRTKTTKSYIISVPQQVALSKIKRAIQNLAKISQQNQLLVYRGKQISNAQGTIRFDNASILHVVDKSKISKGPLNIVVKSVQDIKKNVHRSYKFASVNIQMKISEFIEKQMNKIQQFEDHKQLFLVFLGKKLSEQKTFGQLEIQDDSEIYCVHKQLDKKCVKISQIQSLRQTRFQTKTLNYKKSKSSTQTNQQYKKSDKYNEFGALTHKKIMETFVDDLNLKNVESDQQQNNLQGKKSIKDRQFLQPNFKKKNQQFKFEQQIANKTPISSIVIQKAKRAYNLTDNHTVFTQQNQKQSKTAEDTSKNIHNFNIFSNQTIRQGQELNDSEKYNIKNTQNPVFFLNDSLEGMNIDKSSNQSRSSDSQQLLQKKFINGYLSQPYQAQISQQGFEQSETLSSVSIAKQNKQLIAFTFQQIENRASLEQSRQLQMSFHDQNMKKQAIKIQENLISSRLQNFEYSYMNDSQIPLQSQIKIKPESKQSIDFATVVHGDGQAFKRKTEEKQKLNNAKETEYNKQTDLQNLPSSKSIDFDQLAYVQKTSKSIKSSPIFNDQQLQGNGHNEVFHANIQMQSDVQAFKNRLIQKSIQRHLQNEKQINKRIQSAEYHDQYKQRTHQMVGMQSKPFELIEPIYQTEQQKQIQLAKLSHIKIQYNDSSNQIQPFFQGSHSHSKSIQRSNLQHHRHYSQLQDSQPIQQKQQENALQKIKILKHHVEQQLENEVKPYLKKIYQGTIVNYLQDQQEDLKSSKNILNANSGIQNIQECDNEQFAQQAQNSEKTKVKSQNYQQKPLEQKLQQQVQRYLKSVKQSIASQLTQKIVQQPQKVKQSGDQEIDMASVNQYIKELVEKTVKYTIRINTSKSINEQQAERNDKSQNVVQEAMNIIEQFIVVETQNYKLGSNQTPQHIQKQSQGYDLLDFLGISPKQNEQTDKKYNEQQTPQKNLHSMYSQVDPRSQHLNQDSLLDFIPQSNQKPKQDLQIQLSGIKYKLQQNKNLNQQSDILNAYIQRASSDQYSGHFPSRSDENRDNIDTSQLNQLQISEKDDIQEVIEVKSNQQLSFNQILNQSHKQETDPKIAFSFRKNKDVQLTGTDFIVPFSEQIKFPRREDIIRLYQNVSFSHFSESSKSVKSSQQKQGLIDDQGNKRFSLNNKENVKSMENLIPIDNAQYQHITSNNVPNIQFNNLVGIHVEAVKDKIEKFPDSNKNASDQQQELGQFFQQKNSQKLVQK